MKTCPFLFASLASLTLSCSAGAQQKPLPFLTLEAHHLIASYHLGVGFQKTTHLIFPGPVTYVDLGSGGIIADKAQGVDNIVKVKANAAGFAQTNMTVLTADGRLYSFLIDYERDPKIINVNFAGGTGGNDSAPSIGRANQAALALNTVEATAAAVLGQKRTVRRRDRTKDAITLGLHGLYTMEDLFFLQLYLFNQSNIGYDIDFLKLYVRDKKTVRRTAVQETEVTPRYVYNGARGAIAGHTSLERVYVCPKFTIPDDKVFVIELFEKGGGRHLSLTITNRDILKARRFPTTPATVAAR